MRSNDAPTSAVGQTSLKILRILTLSYDDRCVSLRTGDSMAREAYLAVVVQRDLVREDIRVVVVARGIVTVLQRSDVHSLKVRAAPLGLLQVHKAADAELARWVVDRDQASPLHDHQWDSLVETETDALELCGPEASARNTR